MKRLLAATASLLLVVPDIAAAQTAERLPPGANRPARPGGPQVRPSRPGGTGGPQIQPPRPGRPGGPQIQPPRPGRPEIQPPRPGRPEIQPPRPGEGTRPPRPQPGRPQPPRPPRPSRPTPPHRPGAGRPPHFRPIHGPSFQYPRGYRYRRWTIGLLLPSLFLSSAYYYDDWSSIGVGPPPRGYRWVRYGPDLLLVQLGTRRVVDVIYGAFY